MSNPATQQSTASAATGRVHHGSLHAPVTARYPATGAMPKPAPSQRCDHAVIRLV